MSQYTRTLTIDECVATAVYSIVDPSKIAYISYRIVFNRGELKESVIVSVEDFAKYRPGMTVHVRITPERTVPRTIEISQEPFA